MRIPKRQHGFSLLEMIVAVFIFTVLAGAAFALLNASQRRFRVESELLDSFQGARMAMDQIVLDVHTSGYPPISTLFCGTNNIARVPANQVAYPFAWAPNYADPICPPPNPAVGCTVGTTCTIPGNFDLIVETDVDPQNANGVEWVRYQLQGSTLFRAVVPKVAGGNPAAATLGQLQPFVENVVNNPPAATMAQIQAFYPGMFPGNIPVPIFRYSFDSPSVPQVPQNIREVDITLIVMAPDPDPRNRQPRLVTLTGMASRVNPN